MKKTVLNTALSTAFIVAFSFGVSACGGHEEGESHEVLAKDRVDAASALARENAPDAEEFDFPETAVAPVDGTAAADTDAATDTATDAETTDEVAAEETTADTSADSTDADAATTEGTDMETTEAADATAE
ncbi:hypothetical protein [Psychrobacter sp. AOP7-B1-24]|uniref:hypothetical protein n=1 Tax=Psychrobacter sp. AOP7-B1-24 TaxID=3457645 RepID=UPI00402B749E